MSQPSDQELQPEEPATPSPLGFWGACRRMEATRSVEAAAQKRRTQPAEPMLPLTKRIWESGTVIEALKLCRLPGEFLFGPPGKPDPFDPSHRTYVVKPYEPCSPPASQPSAELAEPSAPSQEGLGSAGGAEGCCEEMAEYQRRFVENPRSPIWRGMWKFYPWCGAKLGEGEG